MECSLELGEEKSKNFKHSPSFALVKICRVCLWCSLEYLHAGLVQSILLIIQHEQEVKYAKILKNFLSDDFFKHCFVLVLPKQCVQKGK